MLKSFQVLLSLPVLGFFWRKHNKPSVNKSFKESISRKNTHKREIKFVTVDTSESTISRYNRLPKSTKLNDIFWVFFFWFLSVAFPFRKTPQFRKRAFKFLRFITNFQGFSSQLQPKKLLPAFTRQIYWSYCFFVAQH